MLQTYVCSTIVILAIMAIVAINYFATGLKGFQSEEDSDLEIEKLRILNTSLSNLQLELNRINFKINSVRKPEISNQNEINNVVDVSFTKVIENRVTAVVSKRKSMIKKVIIFTMDSISSYEKNSLSGGAAGELTIRKSLEYALVHFGADVYTATSDDEFQRQDLRNYNYIILDPWTWAAKGWVPKKNLLGLDDRIYILDFFGTKDGLRKPVAGNAPKLKVSPKRFLTAFGSPENTFLGYFIQNHSVSENTAIQKEKQGVIWGKDVKHLKGQELVLQEVAKNVRLVSTSTTRAFSHKNVQWAGHLSAVAWMQLLQRSRFLVGLGNPILGPSAIDAISVGCMFLNPLYDVPVKVNGHTYTSQHPYAEKLGAPFVCNYKQHSVEELQLCVQLAMRTNLPVAVPPDMTLGEYLARVKDIFQL